MIPPILTSMVESYKSTEIAGAFLTFAGIIATGYCLFTRDTAIIVGGATLSYMGRNFYANLADFARNDLLENKNEMGFSLGFFDEDYLKRTKIACIYKNKI